MFHISSFEDGEFAFTNTVSESDVPLVVSGQGKAIPE